MAITNQLAPPMMQPQPDGMLPFGGAMEPPETQMQPMPQVDAATPPLPTSSLGAEVPPGQQIPEHDFHRARMKAFDESADAHRAAAAANSDALANLDVNDPDYAKKLMRLNENSDALHRSHGELQTAKAQEEMANPWGTIGNHPGIGGKIGHAFGTIGNIAGNALLGPGVMSAIPGSEANLQARAKGGQAEENQAEKNEAENATTAHTEAEIPSVEATTKHTEAETRNLENPQLKTVQEQYSAAVADATKRGVDPNTDPKVKQLADTITSLQKQPNTPAERIDQQYQEALEAGDHEKAERLLKVKADLAKAGQAPQRAPITEVVLPGGQVEAARPGMTLPAGTQNIGGFATMNRPTAQERNVSAQAAIAAQGIPQVVAEIDKLGDQLGPVMGRWNEFMQGKVGMDNPEFAGLRADLLMASSAVALAHARGRLPENLRQEFDNAINSPKQTPENLKAVLGHILPWMQRMESIGAVNPEAGGGGTGASQKFSVGGRTYNIPADKVEEFKRDHPDAR